MTKSAASNISLQVGGCHERILLPATDANAEVKEIPGTGSEKKRRRSPPQASQTKRNAIASTTKLDKRNYHGTHDKLIFS
ncbi:hypothetical protein [Nostoc sp. UHCC 0252]|uniref:hypothetical protein n=1 Tax=Nostoc sp. UHCC 0252 TaxID=3110241 RepID=UPI002B21D398|nr:hypothetical protein [Nostoc sp. UHCC 0252]MEA5606127.1 hypothetical protein [Nostoc sp. UHCC 0252]